MITFFVQIPFFNLGGANYPLATPYGAHTFELNRTHFIAVNTGSIGINAHNGIFGNSQVVYIR